MLWEFQIVKPYLSTRSIVVSDDVDFNAAFSDWADQAQPNYWAAVREEDKSGLFAVSIFDSDSLGTS